MLDTESLRFLETLRDAGEKLTTTKIRGETGMNRSQIQYRFEKLQEKGYIVVDEAEQKPDGRWTPKKAKITSDGLDALSEQEHRLSEQDQMEATLEEMREDLDGLSAAVESADGMTDSEFEKFRELKIGFVAIKNVLEEHVLEENEGLEDYRPDSQRRRGEARAPKTSD